MYGTREERSGRVISAVVAATTYNESARELEIRFVTGRTYRYLDVPPEVHEGLQSAPSRGAFFNTEIKDKYKFRDITDHR
jgi:hypothetical protein